MPRSKSSKKPTTSRGVTKSRGVAKKTPNKSASQRKNNKLKSVKRKIAETTNMQPVKTAKTAKNTKNTKINFSTIKPSKKSKSLPAVGHELTEIGRQFIKTMNVELDSISQVKKLQQTIKKNAALKNEDKEFGEIFSLITEFMGDPHVWWAIIQNLAYNGITNEDITSGRKTFEMIPTRVNFPRSGIKYTRPNAFFNGAHWNSQKAGEQASLFDPYDHFQIRGTNQFCQTYSMMHLLNVLPGDDEQICAPWAGEEDDFKKYYYIEVYKRNN